MKFLDIKLPHWGYLAPFVLGVLISLAFRPIEAFDTFWRLQSGKYIWKTREFIYKDAFSTAMNAFRLEHCWLSDLIFYSLYDFSGYPLLNLFKAFAIGLGGALLYRWNFWRGTEPGTDVLVFFLRSWHRYSRGWFAHLRGASTLWRQPHYFTNAFPPHLCWSLDARH